jgi:hypothetical protein
MSRTINPSATWTPSTNCQTVFSQRAPVPMNSDASVAMTQNTFTSVENHQITHPVQQVNINRDSNALDRHEVLSVDSGISDSCVSPTHPSPRVEPARANHITVERTSSASKGKRKQSIGGSISANRPEKDTAIPKR